MTRRLAFHPAVAGDVADAAGFYQAADSDLPCRFRADLRQSLDLVETYPCVGPVLFGDYRHLTLRVFPYMVVYRVAAGDGVRVLAIIHARRDPALMRRLARERRLDAGKGDAPFE